MKREIKTIVLISTGVILIIGLIGFAGARHSDRQVNNVRVEIMDQNGDFFTDQLEVLNLLNDRSTDYVLGLPMKELDLKMLESRVEAHPFVKEAQIFRDIKGNLKVSVTQAQPIARIFNRSGADQYIDRDGRLLPTTGRHTARVPVIELRRKFAWEHAITETAYGADVLELLRFIHGDAFWRAQIAGLTIERNGEVTLMPQVSKQEVQFGMPEDFDRKFKKLKVFYKEILPNKGWNSYHLVNLKFENQIICE